MRACHQQPRARPRIRIWQLGQRAIGKVTRLGETKLLVPDVDKRSGRPSKSADRIRRPLCREAGSVKVYRGLELARAFVHVVGVGRGTRKALRAPCEFERFVGGRQIDGTPDQLPRRVMC